MQRHVTPGEDTFAQSAALFAPAGLSPGALESLTGASDRVQLRHGRAFTRFAGDASDRGERSGPDGGQPAVAGEARRGPHGPVGRRRYRFRSPLR